MSGLTKKASAVRPDYWNSTGPIHFQTFHARMNDKALYISDSSYIYSTFYILSERWIGNDWKRMNFCILIESYCSITFSISNRWGTLPINSPWHNCLGISPASEPSLRCKSHMNSGSGKKITIKLAINYGTTNISLSVFKSLRSRMSINSKKSIQIWEYSTTSSQNFKLALIVSITSLRGSRWHPSSQFQKLLRNCVRVHANHSNHAWVHESFSEGESPPEHYPRFRKWKTIHKHLPTLPWNSISKSFKKVEKAGRDWLSTWGEPFWRVQTSQNRRRLRLWINFWVFGSAQCPAGKERQTAEYIPEYG